MCHRRIAFLCCHLGAFPLSAAGSGQDAKIPSKDEVLFDFVDEARVKDWAPARLPELENEAPAPQVEIVSAPRAIAGATSKWLKITFAGRRLADRCDHEDSSRGKLEAVPDAQGRRIIVAHHLGDRADAFEHLAVPGSLILLTDCGGQDADCQGPQACA